MGIWIEQKDCANLTKFAGSHLDIWAQTSRNNRKAQLKGATNAGNGSNTEKRKNAGGGGPAGQTKSDNKETPTGGSHRRHG
eukprot:2924554-Heterocapsa_arctica.AAC.1